MQCMSATMPPTMDVAFLSHEGTLLRLMLCSHKRPEDKVVAVNIRWMLLLYLNHEAPDSKLASSGPGRSAIVAKRMAASVDNMKTLLSSLAM